MPNKDKILVYMIHQHCLYLGLQVNNTNKGDQQKTVIIDEYADLISFMFYNINEAMTFEEIG